MGLFCSLVKKIYTTERRHKCMSKVKEIEIEEMNQVKNQKAISKLLIDSQRSIQRMEIASLKKYAQICLTDRSNLEEMSILFFTPAEELSGGNIFSRVSNKFNVMQPYLEKIDSDFISQMNLNVCNISLYVNSNYILINNHRLRLQTESIISKETLQNNNEVFQQNLGVVHMYQDDISGQNVIDYAFKKNAIFCIKAFVDTLLVLT